MCLSHFQHNKILNILKKNCFLKKTGKRESFLFYPSKVLNEKLLVNITDPKIFGMGLQMSLKNSQILCRIFEIFWSNINLSLFIFCKGIKTSA